MCYVSRYISLKEKIAYALKLPSVVASPTSVKEKEFSYLPVTLVSIPVCEEKRERERSMMQFTWNNPVVTSFHVSWSSETH